MGCFYNCPPGAALGELILTGATSVVLRIFVLSGLVRLGAAFRERYRR